MDLNSRTFCRRPSTADAENKAFTLIEIMLAIMILGMLAVLATPFYLRPMANARKNTCLSNQKLLYSMASLYELEVSSLYELDHKGRLETLYNAGYFNNRRAFHCPENRNTEYADYALIYDSSKKLIDVRCLVKPEAHRLELPGGQE